MVLPPSVQPRAQPVEQPQTVSHGGSVAARTGRASRQPMARAKRHEAAIFFMTISSWTEWTARTASDACEASYSRQYGREAAAGREGYTERHGTHRSRKGGAAARSTLPSPPSRAPARQPGRLGGVRDRGSVAG